MSKVCLLGDLHIGARKSSPNFMDLQGRFFSFLLAELEAREINLIIQLGDVYDSHATINLNALAFFKENFLDELRKRNIRMVTIVGNHDIAQKKSLAVNSLDLTMKAYRPDVMVVNKPTQITIKGVECLMVPWICDDNREATNQALGLTTAKYCFGHFEFKDFYMYKGIKNEHGQDATGYSRFDHVFSGHYHHRNQHGNVTYVGTPYELVWTELNDPKGFTVLDLESGITEYIQSPYTIFKKVYAASSEDVDAILADKSFEKHYVKLYLSCDSIDKEVGDKLKNHIESCGCYDLEVVDVRATTLSDMDDDLDLETVELRDSKSILDMHIDKIADIVDRTPLRQLMYSLYTEALDAEEN